MKKLFILLLVLIAEGTFAQSIEILPGVILPQMTTTQRTTMENPANGALVFDKTTQSYWYRQSGAWAELPKAGSTANYWQLSGINGSEIRNTNSGGFWSKNPTEVKFIPTPGDNLPTVPVNEIGTRLMWIPSRAAFRVGSVDNVKDWAADSIGLFSFAAGWNALASGKGAIALGMQTKSRADYTTTFGVLTQATNDAAVAIGYETLASGGVSTAMGYKTIASGGISTAMGSSTEANGQCSLVSGLYSKANGYYSFALGREAYANGDASIAMGYKVTADGVTAIAMGNSTSANGSNSVAIGYKVAAGGEASTALGNKVSTGTRKGAFVIGDSDPDSEGETVVGVTDQFVARFKNGYYLLTSGNANPRTGVQIANGQTAWSAISDSTRKERFVKADGETFLTKLRGLRLGSWNYKNQKTNQPERFYGPMAQEIFSAFGKDTYGTIGTDTTVSTLNMDGLLFIFSQALEKRTQNLRAENQQLKAEINTLKQSDNSMAVENQALKAMIQQLGTRLESLETTLRRSNESHTGR